MTEHPRCQCLMVLHLWLCSWWCGGSQTSCYFCTATNVSAQVCCPGHLPSIPTASHMVAGNITGLGLASASGGNLSSCLWDACNTYKQQQGEMKNPLSEIQVRMLGVIPSPLQVDPTIFPFLLLIGGREGIGLVLHNPIWVLDTITTCSTEKYVYLIMVLKEARAG